MKSGIIITPNSKGQIVIPQPMRKALGITTGTHLHLLQRGHGMYLYPIQEVVGQLPHENHYPAILKETKGTWQEQWETVRAKRKKTELAASKKRKTAW